MMAKGGVDVMIKRVSFIDDGNGIRPIEGDDINRIEQINHKLSSDGLRVLAFASKKHKEDQLELEDEQELTFIGLAAMMDPPRSPRTRPRWF